jgi:hypothetical protein
MNSPVTTENTGAVSVQPMTVEQLVAVVKANLVIGTDELSLEEYVYMLPEVLEEVLAMVLSEFNYKAHPGSHLGKACRCLATISVRFREEMQKLKNKEGGTE